MPTPESSDPRQVVESTLLATRTTFEAHAIALALGNRGIAARVVEPPMGDALSRTPTSPRVIVPANLMQDARRMLDSIRQEASEIDWNSVDLHDAPGADHGADDPIAPGAPSRWQATLGVILVPVGLLVISLGSSRRDSMLQGIGLAVLGAALVIILAFLLASGAKKPKA